MGLLSHRPKTSVEEFCRQFYDCQIFHAIVAGSDVGSTFWEVVFKSVAESDHSFAGVDFVVFKHEMTALRIELFGLALSHHFEKEHLSLLEVKFTKRYLDQTGQSEIWDAMAEYNSAIAQALAMPPEVMKPARRDFEPLVSPEVGHRAFTEALIHLRSDLADKWVRDGVEPEYAVRAANRLSTGTTWNEYPVLRMLVSVLAHRLGCSTDLKPEALFRVTAVLDGLYNGAKEAIESVNFQIPSPNSP